MKSNLLLISFLSLFFIRELEAQKKFEIGAGIDPLVIPLNIGNTQERGLGYYDIGVKSAITQSFFADFTYWPFLHVGFSLGYKTHNYKSTIHCSIPDLFTPFDPGPYQNTLSYTSSGHGPLMALRVRGHRFKVRIGANFIVYNNHESDYVNHGILNSTFDSHGTIETIDLTERSMYGPFSHDLLNLEVEYNPIDNLYVMAGFEKSESGFTLYAAQVNGYLEEMGPPERTLNDFEFKSNFTALTLGIRYYLGFGGYPRKEGIRHGG